MKSYIAATAFALASVATAQLSDIPSCALSCLLTGISSDGCSSSDYACSCKKYDSLISSVTPCVQSSCSASEQADTITAVQGLCAENGVTISVSAPASTAASSAAESSTSEAAAATTTEAPASSGYATTVVTSEVAVTTVVPSSVSGAPTASGNGTVSTTGSPSQYTGAAAHATQAAGVIGAAALAFLAL